MNKYIRYEHHGKQVTVRSDLKGKHREYCLCFSCDKFKLEDRENNCKKANLLFSVDVALDITTPVWECSTFIPRLNGANI